MVLTVPSHKTGQPPRTPMTPFTVDGQLYTVAGYPGADWERNARAAGAGTLSHGRKNRPVLMVELSDHRARPVLRAVPSEVPIAVGFLERGVRLIHRAGPGSRGARRSTSQSSDSTRYQQAEKPSFTPPTLS